MSKNKYFKVSDFAKLCHTTKDTLLHYDRKGILSPKYIGENGYRYYGMEQFFEYDIIALLKVTGCTLEEIKQYNENSDNYINLIKKRIPYLKKEQQRLNTILQMLTQITELAEQAQEKNYHTLYFEEVKTQKVQILPIHNENITNTSNLAKYYSDCLLFCLQNGNDIDPPLGMIITEKNIQKNTFCIEYLFTKNLENTTVKTKKNPKREICLFFTSRKIRYLSICI